MPEFKQEYRLIAIYTPLGEDVLLLQSFTGREGISQLFHFDCECFSETATINYDDIIGKKVTLKIRLVDDTPHYINGIVSRFWQSGQSQRFTQYRVEVVPWLWMLSRTSNCRIFQNKSVGAILKQVFSDLGFNDFKPKHSNDPTLEYCVQYRETDLNFVCRLMEQYGISYYFEHEEQKHTLVTADSASFPVPCPNAATARYHSTLGGFQYDEDVVTAMQVCKEVRPGKYTLSDFNFETPLVDLTASVSGDDTRKYEQYDYPGEYKTKGEGDAIAGMRMDEEESPTTVVRASSSCRAFRSGYRFELQEHYRSDLNKGYVLTEVQHSATVGQNYTSSESDSEAEHYFNYFIAIPYPTKLRPPRLTPRPVIQGLQTAVVVGPAGEEIYSDKYGRVKVQFHWDRVGTYNEDSSCWIRVSQGWAGKNWGSVWLPRIGQEVIVEFEEGDPDRPVITGRVYNAENMPPYALPDQQTKSTIKSYSSKGGGGFNEFRFEDKKGSEQIFLHAQSNYDLRVLNDRKEITLRDQHLIVERDQLEKVKRNKHQEVVGDLNVKVGGAASWAHGQDCQHKVTSNYGLQANNVHIKAAMNVVVEAGLSLTIKAAGGFITIDPGGVTIVGTMVKINSGGSAGTGAGCSPESPEPALEADNAEPGKKPSMPPPKPPRVPGVLSPGALVLKHAAVSGIPFCDI